MRVNTPSLDKMVDEVVAVDYRQATDTFCRLVTEERQPFAKVVQTAIGAAAPFIQLPSHLMMQGNGEIRGVNYDHTVLGWRGALALRSHLSEAQRELPSVQAMWYLPQGLNIWEQIICEFPGGYARDGGCNKRFPDPSSSTDRFDGPTWISPKVYFEDRPPIIKGGVHERMEHFMWSVVEGERDDSYGLFLGLAEDKENRNHLKEALLRAGICDLQDTLINRGGYQNLGHKALRARALMDIADFLGWENSHDIFYSVVPDLGCSPRLHGLWTEIGLVVKAELPDMASIPKRGRPLAEWELDRLAETMLWGGAYEVNAELVQLYRKGHGILDIADGVVVSYQQYMIEVLEHPNSFSSPMHSFDYCNVVNTWLREFSSVDQVRGPFMAARFMNDAVRFNSMFPRDPRFELESRHNFRAWADSLSLMEVLPQLETHILAQDSPRSCALVDSYLARTDERDHLKETVAFAACHYQNDPHIVRNSCSSIEEFNANQTPRRDDILRGFVKHQSRYVKRSTSLDAFSLYEDHFAAGGARR